MSPHDADQTGPRITFASIEPAVAAFADINAAHAAERKGAAHILAVMMTYSDLGDRLRVLVERIAATLNNPDHNDYHAALEDAHHTLTALIGDPDPAPHAIVARVEHTDPGKPFDRITIEHPDGSRETLDVPERHTPCSLNPDGCRLGPHRFGATLRAAGYRQTSDHAAEPITVERITDQEGTRTP